MKVSPFEIPVKTEGSTQLSCIFRLMSKLTEFNIPLTGKRTNWQYFPLRRSASIGCSGNGTNNYIRHYKTGNGQASSTGFFHSFSQNDSHLNSLSGCNFLVSVEIIVSREIDNLRGLLRGVAFPWCVVCFFSLLKGFWQLSYFPQILL